ncbi:MAG: tetratricopeptide repeat protein [Bacteroidia bacterium]|nr:tetratricopeptide repeat protein [Bacteroidia bacterium]NNF31059.1 tetratricopeptide repeat protein [Flavobacteriaceae bacterium]MBT8276977.1 tetratricopeptide repeat protein [Bacteroidia bacterium]NNJ81779.1 tetratricopeptide repeat protein [Flavobacteriaceae bacterium]NNK55293.1 tetratricopeptide repeat protein [Flavobacteriaceae bacterium]
MDNRLLTVIFLLNISIIFSQNNVIPIVEEGIAYHDRGEFDKAIEIYKTALEIDPESAMVFYEIGLSYYHKGDYKAAIKYYDKVLKKNEKYLLPATINKGLSLDNLGKSKAALKLFKRAVNEFKNEPRLHYNLGYQYYQKDDMENAIREVSKSIELDPEYSTSHLLMGFLQFSQNNRVQALLSYHYFLLLEPGSDRAEGAFYDINSIMGGNISVAEDDPKSINISLSANLNSEFSASELLLALLVAQNNEKKNKDKTEEELFIENTTKFFKHLGELKADNNNPRGIYWNLYIPFFEGLAESGHMTAYFHHITENIIEDSAVWIENHTIEMFAFEKWLDR